MPNPKVIFWESFRSKDFSKALKQLNALEAIDQQAILEELFQKSEYHRKPILVSVLRRELHDNQSFDDFYQSWLPSENMVP